MNFLDELRTKKHGLKATTTKVKYLDGRQFEESRSSDTVQVAKAQFGFIVDTKPDNIPAKIIPHLFLGSQDCCGLDTLTDYQIRYVLSVGIEAPTKYDDLVYKFVHCLDLPETNLRHVLNESIGFIKSAVQEQCNILVHCNAGVSRSASVVIGYLILVCHLNYLEAYNAVKNVRSCIRPNDGFVEQLKKLSN